MIYLGDSGARAMLAAYFNSEFPVVSRNLSLRLFTNDWIPADGDKTSDYVEASDAGYARKVLINGNWLININHDPPDVTYSTQTFVFSEPLSAGVVVYGYFVVDSDKR